jgi:PAS domain S-box-containing protein
VNDRSRPPEAAPRSLRDLLIIGGVLVTLFALGAALGVFEHLSDWILTREQRGGVFALLTLLAIGAAVFSALRWRQAAVETRKRIEAERGYRLLVEQAPVVIYAWEPTGPTGEASPQFVSPQIEALLGYSAGEWTADPGLWIRRIHPDDRDEVLARSEEADRTGGGFHMEYRALHRNGRILWIHDEARPVTWREDGTPARVQGVMVDISRTMAAEEQQRETQRRFQALFERLPAVTYVEDAETRRYRYLSPQIEGLTGYPVQRWIDDPDLWAKALHPGDRERVLAENEADGGDSWSVE